MSHDLVTDAARRVVVYGDAFADRIPELGQLLGSSYNVLHVPYSASTADAAAAFAGSFAVIAVRTDPGLPMAADLRLLQVPGIGWDGVDPAHVPAAARICNVGGHETAVAEYCIAQLLDWRHRLSVADLEFRQGSWLRSSRFGGKPHRELHGATVGIIGFGAVGRTLAPMLHAFGVRVVAANRSPIDEQAGLAASYRLDNLPEMLAECDFAISAIALTPETEGLLGARELAALGPQGMLINVARGPVVDETALWDALRRDRLGGAVLDVWYRYPASLMAPDLAPAQYDFAALPNVVMTPHISGWTEGTVARRVAAIAENIRHAAAHEALAGIVAQGTRD